MKRKRGVHNADEIKRLIESSTRRLAEIMNDADRIAVRLHRDSGDGFPRRTGVGGGRASYMADGSLPGPTPGVAAQRDPFELLANRLMRALTVIETESLTAVVAARAARGLDHDTAQRMAEAEQPNGDHCCNCNEWVPGVGEHRIRSGRCPACYMYRVRHDGVDRRIEPTTDGLGNDG